MLPTTLLHRGRLVRDADVVYFELVQRGQDDEWEAMRATRFHRHDFSLPATSVLPENGFAESIES